MKCWKRFCPETVWHQNPSHSSSHKHSGRQHRNSTRVTRKARVCVHDSALKICARIAFDSSMAVRPLFPAGGSLLLFFLLGVWMMHTWIVSWWDKSKIPGTNWVQFYEKFSDFDVSCCDVAWMSLLVAICRPRLRWTDCGTVGLQSLVSFWIGCPGPLSFRRCNTWEKEVY